MSKMNIRKNIKINPLSGDTEVTNGSILLQFGCADLVKYNDNTHRDKVKIFLQLKDEHYKEFKEDLLQKLALTIQLVSGFILGPQTVVELYNDPFMNDLADIVINDTTDKIAIFHKECFADEMQIDYKFRGKGQFIRSIKLWNYEYYMNYQATRYCNTDFDCRLSEYCLCLNGNYNGELCPAEKKRCMPMAEYNDKLERNITSGELVDQQCLNKGINGYKNYWNTKTIPYGDLKRISSYCSKKEHIDKFPQNLSLNYYLKVDNVNPKFKGDGYKISEHFSNSIVNDNDKKNYMIICVIIIAIIVCCYLCYK